MSETSEPAICPICGKEAERGAVYSREGAVQWIKGKPDWKKRLAAIWGSNEIIGKVGLFTASYAPGILCRSCRRVILEFPAERKEYFPDVRG
jgi:hypothetical protein